MIFNLHEIIYKIVYKEIINCGVNVFCTSYKTNDQLVELVSGYKSRKEENTCSDLRNCSYWERAETILPMWTTLLPLKSRLNRVVIINKKSLSYIQEEFFFYNREFFLYQLAINISFCIYIILPGISNQLFSFEIHGFP